MEAGFDGGGMGLAEILQRSASVEEGRKWRCGGGVAAIGGDWRRGSEMGI